MIHLSESGFFSDSLTMICEKVIVLSRTGMTEYIDAIPGGA